MGQGKSLMTGTRVSLLRYQKKGALSECSNWRGITLLSTPSEIFAKIIMKRLSLAVALNSVRNRQVSGEKRVVSIIFFTLRNIIEQSTEWQRTRCINFIDFAKVFDSVHQHSLWKILRAYEIPS